MAQSRFNISYYTDISCSIPAVASEIPGYVPPPDSHTCCSNITAQKFSVNDSTQTISLENHITKLDCADLLDTPANQYYAACQCSVFGKVKGQNLQIQEPINYCCTDPNTKSKKFVVLKNGTLELRMYNSELDCSHDAAAKVVPYPKYNTNAGCHFLGTLPGESLSSTNSTSTSVIDPIDPLKNNKTYHDHFFWINKNNKCHEKRKVYTSYQMHKPGEGYQYKCTDCLELPHNYWKNDGEYNCLFDYCLEMAQSLTNNAAYEKCENDYVAKKAKLTCMPHAIGERCQYYDYCNGPRVRQTRCKGRPCIPLDTYALKQQYSLYKCGPCNNSSEVENGLYDCIPRSPHPDLPSSTSEVKQTSNISTIKQLPPQTTTPRSPHPDLSPSISEVKQTSNISTIKQMPTTTTSTYITVTQQSHLHAQPTHINSASISLGKFIPATAYL
eukprot:Pgem_evm1s19706